MQIKETTQTSQRVLIAGCGDIGIHLALRLSRQGHKVYGLRRNINQLPEAIHGISADLGDLSQLSQLRSLPAIDMLVYCVAASQRDEAGYRQAYVQGLANLQEVLAEQPVKRILFVSSSAVYHQNDDSWVDETSPTAPPRFNGQVMLEAEQQVLNHSIPGTVVRFSGIYGPGRSHLLSQVYQGKGYSAEPAQFSNRIHRDDCSGVLAHLINLELQGEPLEDIYLASDDYPSGLHEVSHWLAKEMGVEITEEAAPRSGGSKKCTNRRLHASGYRFEYPDFRAGYKDLIREFMAQKSEG
ncbi:SDR family oxidoreductase [Aliamphritea spongicola]|uniref:SDR family oxidoreductase n=1 Tax=Aliamphritea spongicola TaxID=707589 RepID=UPI00196A3B96|nr:SDR family oxidoreductase [Aliamphritea spongicola]MBN3562044.1 SDR family oxidoreductase [Aliamphritea spongicola]